MEIRVMAEKDLLAAAKLEEMCFTRPWTREMLVDSLETGHYTFLGAWQKEKLLGYVGLYQVLDEGEVTDLAVDPKERRRGIGRRLMEELLQEAVSRKLLKVTLEVRVTNQAAIGLYESLDFKKIGLRKNYYEDPAEDAVLYGRTLS